jgi:hypothetical protein
MVYVYTKIVKLDYEKVVNRWSFVIGFDIVVRWSGGQVVRWNFGLTDPSIYMGCRLTP